MGSRAQRADNYGFDFGNDPVYSYQSPRGEPGFRNFSSVPKHGPYHSGAPLFGTGAGATAAPAASSLPLIAGIITVSIITIGLAVALPVIVIFAVPNSTTDVTTAVTTTTSPSVIVPTVTNAPGVTPVTVAPPSITLLVSCPSNIRQNTSPGVNYAIVTWDTPQVITQTVGRVNLVPSKPPNSRFNIGSETVTYTATNNNNRGTCSFTVTVVDNEPPSIQCPGNIVKGTDPGSISAGVTWSPPTITENSGSSSYVVKMTDDSGDQFHIGQHTVTIVVTDTAGNENRCSFTITISDDEKPQVTCPSDQTAYTNDPGGSAPGNWPAPTVTDNGLGQTQPAVCAPASGSPFGSGTTPVTCTARDAAGNEGICMFNVIVRFNDTAPPVFSGCPEDISVNTTSASSIVSWTAPTATDNSQKSPTISSNSDPGDQFNIGTNEVIYTATDDEGNSAQCKFNVHVLDPQDPVITCPSGVTQATDAKSPSATVTLPAATASDNSGQVPTITTSPPGSPVLPIGNQMVTYIATDGSGNTAECVVTVTVIDEEPPEITCRSTYTIRAEENQPSATISLPDSAVLTDNSGGMISITTAPGNNSVFAIGSHEVIYTATDPSGNTAMCNVTVRVVDFQTPDLTCPNNITKVTDDGLPTATVTFMATVIDNSGILIATPDHLSGSAFPIGVTEVTYTATDVSGNTATCTFTITIEDDEDPVITCPTDMSRDTDAGKPDTTVTLLSATATDNSGTAVSVTHNPSAVSPVLEIGVHTVTYTATDGSGNTAMCNLTITINDVEPPTLTVPSNFNVKTDSGQSYATVDLPYPSNIMDNSGGIVTITTSPGNNSMLNIGSHDIMYSATDPSGNTYPFTVTVTVVDEEKPMLVCPDDVTQSTDLLQPTATVNYTPRTLTDNDGMTPSLTSDYTGITYNIGSTVVTLTARDTAGNEAMCTFTITIQDDEDPVITCPPDISRDTDAGQPSTTVTLPSAALATDNSGTVVSVTQDASGTPVLAIGVHTVTYTATDGSGNTAMCNLTITINDVELPTLTVPLNFNVKTDSGQSYATVELPYPSNIMDNSGGVVTITTSPGNNSMLNIGSHDIMYSATDPSGNTYPFTVTVTVVDEEPPMLVCPDDIINSTDQLQPTATVNFTPRTLTDNDGMTPSLTSNYSGSTYNIGSTVVALTARDTAGNKAMCTFTITVEDKEPPVLQCPSVIALYTDNIAIPLTFSAVAMWTVNVTDNSGLPLMSETSTHLSGSVFAAPSTTVTYTAVDAFNNTNQCSFDITVTGFVSSACQASGVDIDLSTLIGTGVKYNIFSRLYDAGMNYPSGENCLWRITAPPGSFIRLNFMAFDTEFSKDTLSIGSGTDPSLVNTTLESYGGKLPELESGTADSQVRLFGDSIWLQFISDGTFAQTYKGFWLTVDYVANPRSLYPDTYSICLDDGGFPCQDGTCIDKSKRCDGAFDCPTNREDELECPPSCTPTVEESEKFPTSPGVDHIDIVSKNYPGEYPLCNARWTIDSNGVQSLRLVVMDIQLDARDKLFVANGNGMQVTPDIDSPVSLFLNGSDFTLVFESGGGVGRGFWIRVWRYIGSITSESVDFPSYCELALHNMHCGNGMCITGQDRCNGDSDCPTFMNDMTRCTHPTNSPDCGNANINLAEVGSTYELTSVNYPSDYFHNIDCGYTVTATAAAKIRVSFRDVEIVPTSGTDGDYLRIGNGNVIDMDTLITVNGFFAPNDLVSSGNQLWIKFVSDGRRVGRGFWITLVAMM